MQFLIVQNDNYYPHIVKELSESPAVASSTKLLDLVR